MGVVQNEEWTADVVGRMHRYRITNQMLAEQCGYSHTYLSTVLNGGKQFESEAAKQKTQARIINALAELEAEIEVASNDQSGANQGM